MVGGKRRDMGLGGYPDVPLADAREAARAARAKIRAGADPIDDQKRARELLRLEKANAATFTEAAKAYIQIHEPSWENVKHAQQWRNTLKTYADKAEAAYRRGDLLEKRRLMMDDRAKFLGRVERPAEVIDMTSQRA